MRYTIFGIFEKNNDVEDVLQDLDRKGYEGKEVSIVMKDTGQGKEMEQKTGRKVTGTTATGIKTGALVGGLAGLVASFMIPGLGLYFIGGPIAGALGLTGAAATTFSGAATGALAGGFIGALTGLGLSIEEARSYEQRVEEGAILIVIPAHRDEEMEVAAILASHHADSIRSVRVPEQGEPEYRDRPERYAEPTQAAYMGVKGGKAGKR